MDCIRALERGCRWKSPAWATCSLVFNMSHFSFTTPINFIVIAKTLFGGAMLKRIMIAMLPACICSIPKIKTFKLIRCHISELIDIKSCIWKFRRWSWFFWAIIERFDNFFVFFEDFKSMIMFQLVEILFIVVNFKSFELNL